jgi:hypothetical protein
MDEPEVKLTNFQQSIKHLEEAHFIRIPSAWNVFPDPGQYVTKVTAGNLGILVCLIDTYAGYYFDSDGKLLERIEIEREKTDEEKNIPEASVEIFPNSEVWEGQSEEGEELADEG